MASPVAWERWAMAPRGLPADSLVEGVGTGGLRGELDHLLDAGLVDVTAGGVLLAQKARLLAAMSAGAVQGLEELC